MHRSTLAAALTLLLLPVGAAAQSPGAAGELPPALARRADVAPVIDGRGEDAVWAVATPVTDFWQKEPEEGGAMAQPTEFRVAYDPENLYLLVRAFDSAPDSTLRALARRDSDTPSDQIGVVVDSYHDRRSGYEFVVNLDGVKRDNAISNDGNFDSSWDGIWDVVTTMDASGWTAEFRIPLSQLRYPDAPSHTFGLAVQRTVQRHSQVSSWPRLSRNRPGFASQLGTLAGLTGLGSSRSIEATPYLVAKRETQRTGVGFSQDHGIEVGGDLKLKPTPNLTILGTVNPDFGQVEADPAVLNLDAFEVFLNEQRPFFVEGAGLYAFRLNCPPINCGSEGLFYSRRIGRTPELRGRYGDATTPIATPIAAAAKITGQTGGGLSFGALSALTRSVEGLQDRTAEPLTNRAVVTTEQSFRGGDASVRAMGTAVNRSLDEWTRPFMHESAYAALLNARTRFGGGNYEATGWVAASRVAGSPAAIALTQQSAAHYYQQPGDDLVFDPTRTSLSGSAFQLTVGKNGGGITRFQTSFIRQSAGFETNDLGYLRRADFNDLTAWGSLQFNTPTRLYRRYQLNANVWQHWTTSGRVIQRATNWNTNATLHNNWNVRAGFTLGGLGQTFCDRCTRGGPLLRKDTWWEPWFGFNGDNRRTLSPGLNVNMFFADGGRTRAVGVSPSVDVRVATNLDGEIGLNVRRNEDHTQWIENGARPDGSTRHVFAHLDQWTRSASVRVNYTARPNLTVQLYGEPFLSSGDYSDFREVSATPEAESYDARFVAYAPAASTSRGFHSQQLRTNLVVRWEYLPGSTLFLAWAHGRQASGGPTELSWQSEVDDLFELHPDNTFMIKVAHWLSW
jgi:hypothetical protein